jgi:hypothetical protein
MQDQHPTTSNNLQQHPPRGLLAMNDIEFGAKFGQLLDASHLTKYQIASFFGVVPEAVRLWRKGERKFHHRDRLFKFAQQCYQNDHSHNVSPQLIEDLFVALDKPLTDDERRAIFDNIREAPETKLSPLMLGIITVLSLVLVILGLVAISSIGLGYLVLAFIFAFALTITIQHLGSTWIDPPPHRTLPNYWATRDLDDKSDPMVRRFWWLGAVMVLLPGLFIAIVIISKHFSELSLIETWPVLFLPIGALAGLGFYRFIRRTIEPLTNSIAAYQAVLMMTLSCLLIVCGIFLALMLIDALGFLHS